MKQYIQTYKEYKPLLYEFVKRDIKVKYKNSFLGILWSMLNPLLTMLVLTFIFSNIFKNSIPNFPVYCLAGRLIYDFFSQSTNQCMTSITSKSSLIKKIYIPQYIYPLSRIISTFIIFIISLIPLFIVMIITGVKLKFINLFMIYPLAALFFISLGIGLILATINVFFRDMQHIYSVILMLIMYMSAIFYSSDIVTPTFKWIMQLNPIYPVISIFRDCILYSKITLNTNVILCVVYSILYMILGFIVFNKNKDKFILYV
ncbi:ABC transporter permease [Romboutsia lituseburensis]|uniref:Transport permease protein n=1 Tax=Romboutsia lituseburensis DSM 797 TaxID=1121325 RepID=A0A1G9QPX8_9FIRM|nr:ABC transporter permease [Romboutsia lituseburensis]CEH35621.1 O-antigen export system ATP-binding protein [Romboutsia lituseburensis]SDM12920.1 ABC-2 type transport system permease protein [Romboutsia lituseburensis DSM 797]